MSYLQAALEVCANDHFGTIAPSMSFPGKVSGFWWGDRPLQVYCGIRMCKRRYCRAALINPHLLML